MKQLTHVAKLLILMLLTAHEVHYLAEKTDLFLILYPAAAAEYRLLEHIQTIDQERLCFES